MILDAMGRTATVVVVGVLAAMGGSGRAHACDIPAPTLHAIDPAMVGVDQTAPVLPQPQVGPVTYHDEGCGSSCGEFADVEISNLATDDMTPPERIGYRFAVVAGTPPADFAPPSRPQLARWNGKYLLGLSGTSESFDFTLSMVAIDAAGNESAPQTVRISQDAGVCSIGRGRRAGVPTLAIVALVLAAAARRRGGRARRRTMGALLAIAAFVAIVAPGRAHACSFAGPTPHIIDPAMVGVDQTPPTLPQPAVAEITHNDSDGCMETSSCHDIVSARITNLAIDDTTSSDQIGYRFAVIAGTPPAGFSLPTGTVRMPIFDGSFYLHWTAGQDVDVTLNVFAVDAAGNQSGPQMLRIHEDLGGCSVGRSHPALLTLAVVAVVTLATAARRRPRQRR